jgi:uncharacterized membrane protein
MPNLAANHPQVVHFAVALLLTGVAFRLVSLTGRLVFTKHAAAVLLILGTLAAAVSVKSGLDAHGPVERIPGARTVVQEHEEYGIDARNVFYVVAAVELLALGLAAGVKTSGYAKFAYVASALVGIYGTSVLYEAAEHGGELVYSYAGGPGLRTGEAVDVERLLLAGLYNQSVNDRKAGHGADAARLVTEMATRFPGDTTIAFLQVESLLNDSKDPAAALAKARSVSVDEKSIRFVTRKASLIADAFVALGQRDSARVALEPVVAAFPQNTRLKAKLDSLR